MASGDGVLLSLLEGGSLGLIREGSTGLRVEFVGSCGGGFLAWGGWFGVPRGFGCTRSSIARGGCWKCGTYVPECW